MNKKLPKDLIVVHNIFGEYIVCKNNKIFNVNGKNVDSGITRKEAIENYFKFAKELKIKIKIKKEIDIEKIKKILKFQIKESWKQHKEESESWEGGRAEGLKFALKLLKEEK